MSSHQDNRKTCGDVGGRTRDGAPCIRPSGWGLAAEFHGLSPCRDHVENPELYVQSRNQSAFLAAFIEVGTVSGAARAAGICRDRHYEWLQFDPTYPARFAAAKIDAKESLEEEAILRGKFGRPKKLWHDGKPIIDPSTGEQAVEYVRSDVLLIFALKGLDPEKYRDRHEVSGTGKDGAIPVHHHHDFGERSIADLVALRESLLQSALVADADPQTDIAPETST